MLLSALWKSFPLTFLELTLHFCMVSFWLESTQRANGFQHISFTLCNSTAGEITVLSLFFVRLWSAVFSHSIGWDWTALGSFQGPWRQQWFTFILFLYKRTMEGQSGIIEHLSCLSHLSVTLKSPIKQSVYNAEAPSRQNDSCACSLYRIHYNVTDSLHSNMNQC